MSAQAIERLTQLISEERGLLAQALLPAPAFTSGDPGLGALAAEGPLARSGRETFALAVEAAYEGYLLHDGRSRVLDTTDLDLALLAGDRLYAMSLALLAQAGALAAVRELSDVISLGAQSQAEATPEVAAAVWEAGATAIGWGPSAELSEAKLAAKNRDPAAADSLREAARRLRGGGAGAG